MDAGRGRAAELNAVFVEDAARGTIPGAARERAAIPSGAPAPPRVQPCGNEIITRGLLIWRISDPAFANAMKLDHPELQTREFTIGKRYGVKAAIQPRTSARSVPPRRRCPEPH